MWEFMPDPGDEGTSRSRGISSSDAMEDDPGDRLRRGSHVAGAARQHVDLDAGPYERFRELADVSREPSCDDRRVLPRQDQNALAERRAILSPRDL
jgi:hypothetical protein